MIESGRRWGDVQFTLEEGGLPCGSSADAGAWHGGSYVIDARARPRGMAPDPIKKRNPIATRKSITLPVTHATL
jgi:hypothetical protein